MMINIINKCNHVKHHDNSQAAHHARISDQIPVTSALANALCRLLSASGGTRVLADANSSAPKSSPSPAKSYVSRMSHMRVSLLKSNGSAQPQNPSKPCGAAPGMRKSCARRKPYLLEHRNCLC